MHDEALSTSKALKNFGDGIRMQNVTVVEKIQKPVVLTMVLWKPPHIKQFKYTIKDHDVLYGRWGRGGYTSKYTRKPSSLHQTGNPAGLQNLFFPSNLCHKFEPYAATTQFSRTAGHPLYKSPATIDDRTVCASQKCDRVRWIETRNEIFSAIWILICPGYDAGTRLVICVAPRLWSFMTGQIHDFHRVWRLRRGIHCSMGVFFCSFSIPVIFLFFCCCCFCCFSSPVHGHQQLEWPGICFCISSFSFGQCSPCFLLLNSFYSNFLYEKSLLVICICSLSWRYLNV